MRKHALRPSLNDVLEDRLALSHAGASAVAHVALAHPKVPKAGHTVLRSATVNSVNHKIDIAFAQFNNEYQNEITQVARTGNKTTFQNDLTASGNKLKQALDKQAARIPGGSQSLAPVLNARVDSLVHDLAKNTTQASTSLVRSAQSGGHADVATYIHNEVAKGVFTVK